MVNTAALKKTRWTRPPSLRINCRMDFHLEMAPMQGFTDHLFRDAYRRYFSGIDGTYSPFILLERGGIRRRDDRELAAGRDEGEAFVPQIAAGSAEEARQLKTALCRAGFQRVNLNLGCPYPMLTKKRRGAGALPHPTLVSDILTVLGEEMPKMVVSVKTRLGMTDADELAAVIPVLNRFDLEKIILHPRVAAQQYSGAPDWRRFDRYGRALNAPVIANGDIDTPAAARNILHDHPFAKGLMLGRGLLMDPFLPMRIREIPLPTAPGAALRGFHDHLFCAYEARLSPPHLLHRMTAFWSYFAASFPRGKKIYKAVKKSKHIEAYHAVVEAAFSAKQADNQIGSGNKGGNR